MSRWGGGNTPRGSLPSTPRATRKDIKEGEQEEEFDEAMANAERELADNAEWKRIQQNTFTRWVNEHLRQAGTSIDDLETDFSDGLKLIALLEVLSGKKMPRHNKKTAFRSQKLENVSIALKFLEAEGVHLVNIDSTDITDKKLKLIMGLVWTLILHYSITMPMYDGPELGGGMSEKTPKERLMGWLQNKLPNIPIHNFTSDWNDGKKVGALVDSVAPGLCPDWEDWDPNEPIRNAREAMDMADNWLGVPKLLTPEEIVNPNVDELSMMTYLSNFPNSKMKEGAPLRAKAVPSKVKAYGPGLEPTGVVAKAPANFTVETFGAGDGELTITAKGPNDVDYKVDKNFNNDRKKSYGCSYYPDKEGDYVVTVLFAGRGIPNSPYNVLVEGFAGDASKVTAAGPGIEPEGVVAGKPTNFDIFTAGAGKGKPEVIVLDPNGRKDTVPAKISAGDNDVYRCDYMPSQLGVHSVNVFFAGNPIPDSPFGVKVGPASNPGKVTASGRGLQPQGVRALETVDFKVFTEGAGDGVSAVKIIGPGGINVPTTSRNIDPHTVEYKYTPEREGKHVVMITWAGKEIPKSPYHVNVSPSKSSKIKAFGPGLKGGVVDKPALFTVDTCGETGALGFSIEGPSQAKINCKDNGDGSADVDYLPTAPGEYAVHILCDGEDIPQSPYMAQIVPKTDYNPDDVKVYGPGIDEMVIPKQETHFTIDATKAGDAPLDVSLMDDYGEMKPLWKDEHGITDPADGGILAIKLIKGKELMKADLIGKSDPYAVIKHGSQKYTTKVIKNTHEPEWNYEAQITVPDLGDKTITIEVFDKDKLGKDKSLGKLIFDTALVVKQKEIEAQWYPLTGAKSGQVLLSADFLPAEPSVYKAPEILRKQSHANMDVARPVLEQTGPGMFQCRYTPRKTKKLVVNVNYGGVAVPGSPFRVKVDDPTDPAKVRVYGPGVEPGVTANEPTWFTVDSRQAGPGDLEVSIVDNKNKPVPYELESNENGTQNVKYTATKPGIHAVDIKYDGRELPQSPIKVDVKSDLDLGRIKIKDLKPEAYVDAANDFTVDAGSVPAHAWNKIGCTVLSPDGTKLPAVKVGKADGNGQVKVTFVPNRVGGHKINVTCDETKVPGSPFAVTAVKGSNPAMVKAYGPGLEKGYVGVENPFTVETSNAGMAGLNVQIAGPVEAKLESKDNGDGSCSVVYVPEEEGDYEIFVKYDDVDIPDSPFKVPVVPDDGSGSGRKKSDGRGGALGTKDLLAGPGTDGRPGSGEGEMPDGKLRVKVVKAKELISTDMIGKSDPYCEVQYGNQKFRTKVVKNSKEPMWDCDMVFLVPESNFASVTFKVFDKDTIGKDKSLGTLELGLGELFEASIDGKGKWYPLKGVKSGQILLTSDFDPEDENVNFGPAVGKQRASLVGAGVSPNDGTAGLGSKKSSLAGGLKRPGDLEGTTLHVDLIRARDLIKADMIGKSDAYAVLKYADQKDKTAVVKNSQNPKWDHASDFSMKPNETTELIIEVFDADKFGKDKSLGKAEISLNDLGSNEPIWIPLKGVKSGEILINTEFLAPGQSPSGYVGDGQDADLAGRGGDGGSRKQSSLAGGKKSGILGDYDGPVLHVDLIRAKDLIKGDLIGKSDPYAVLKYSDHEDKTPVVKNTQNPKWDHSSDFPADPNSQDKLIVEVFDKDKLGRDKSLGKVEISRDDLDTNEPVWFPLKGVKSGEILLNSEMLAPGQKPSGYGGDRQDYPVAGGDAGSRKPSSVAGGKKSGNLGDYNGPILHVDLIRAKDLVKGDLIGKSDPYATLKYADQQDKTPVIKNTQNPKWDHSSDFELDPNNPEKLIIEVFDKDKFGKDKSLGKVEISRDDLDTKEPVWFPLAGVKSGEILLNTEMLAPGQSPSGYAGDSQDTDVAGKGGDGSSRKPSSLAGNKNSGNLGDYDGPVLHVDLIRAKDLIKTDMIGKSDPYAVLKYADQHDKTPVVKNTQNPKWDHSSDFADDADISDKLIIEVFDKDKFGKDKSLGKVEISRDDLDSKEPVWFPLAGVKSGEILLNTELLGPGQSPSKYVGDGHDADLAGRGGDGSSRKPSSLAGGKKSGNLGDFDGPVLHVDLIRAKDLIKTDMIGKSDPYAVLKYSDQQDKTPVVKNTQNPKWDHSSDFDADFNSPEKLIIEVFDKDKLGKDKSLGKVEISRDDLDSKEPVWFPLTGVKSGEVLINTEMLRPGESPRGYAGDGQDAPIGGKDNDGYSRKPSSLPGSKKSGILGDYDGPILHVDLIRAKDLIKGDLIGKSDPYAVLRHDGQQDKTPVMKNTQNPKWDHSSDFPTNPKADVPLIIEVFDSDKLGKDKSLGKVEISQDDLGANQPIWFPLAGVKSGQILLNTELLAPGEAPSGYIGDGQDAPVYGGAGDSSSRKPSSQADGKKTGLPSDYDGPVLHIDLVRAKDLIKTDMIGKSDPYAVLKYDNQQDKTPVAKNTQNPIWDHKSDFAMDLQNSETLIIEVFDKDKLGKDKSLGKVEVTPQDMESADAMWFPLKGVKSGEILLNTELLAPGQAPTGYSGDGSEAPVAGDANDGRTRKPGSQTGGKKSGILENYDGPLLHIDLVRAKDLIKTDLIGKSDPYAVIKYADQNDKTPVAKNTQNPVWNHSSEFVFDPQHQEELIIEVFDSDKLGKDKSLGKVEISKDDLGTDQGVWFPLKGVKSGQILLNTELLAPGESPLGYTGDGQDAPVAGQDDNHGKSRRPGSMAGGKKSGNLGDQDGSIVHVDLMKARDLMKTDMIGKSDPYAVLKYDNQQDKTPTVKNTQNPEWNHSSDFDRASGSPILSIEVFDSDRFGKDKSLGTAAIDPESLGNLEPRWIPLSGAKSGEILVNTELLNPGYAPTEYDPNAAYPRLGEGPNDDILTRKQSGLGNGRQGAGDDTGSRKPSSQAGGKQSGILGDYEGPVLHLDLIKAKNLIKTDLIGKSDPYAIIKYSGDEDRTPVAKNTQNPEWNHSSDFPADPNEVSNVQIEVFDADKHGKDKSLGTAEISARDLNNSSVPRWFPLKGVKSGEILLNSELLAPGQRPAGYAGDGRLPVGQGEDESGKSRRPGSVTAGKKPSYAGGDHDNPLLHVDLIKAKDLAKGDLLGKSDPYAVLSYDGQKDKTPVIKNTQNPQWDHSADFILNPEDTKNLSIEVFDSDKLGRDKSLGKLELSPENLDAGQPQWFPLKGAKSGALLLNTEFLAPGDIPSVETSGSKPIKGGKGDGAADASKVKAYGPGLEKGNVMPGRPTNFMIDSTKTGPAPITVNVTDLDGNSIGRTPTITPVDEGLHDVSYVPPPVGDPYEVDIRYGGEPIHGAPFKMTSNPDMNYSPDGGDLDRQSRPSISGRKDSDLLGKRKESKIGVSVNPDTAQNLGKIHISLIEAKDLAKTDIMGKSDPYAILSHGNQKFKTNTAKNTQNPKWNYEADFNVPDQGDDRIKVDIYDSDRIGKDKPLGSAYFDVDEVMSKGIVPPGWYPLKGAKSGEVLMAADFEPFNSRMSSPEPYLNLSDSKSGSRAGDRDQPRVSVSSQPYVDEGVLHVDVVAARDLVKSDIMGKSDPYAIVGLGDNKHRSSTAKNTQNPEWNFGVDFPIDSTNIDDDLRINLFDHDKIGKDKSLGTANLPVQDLLNSSGHDAGNWFPLKGVPSGDVLVSTNFVPYDEDPAGYEKLSGRGKGRQSRDDGSTRKASEDIARGKSSIISISDDDLDKNGVGRKRSNIYGNADPRAGKGNAIPDGTVKVIVEKAKNLMKADLIGKSDPYALVACGDDKSKSKTIKNNQNPEWNHEAIFAVDDNSPANINIKVFDADKIGSDKCLGSVDIPLDDLARNGPLVDQWLPLHGGKNGEIQVTALYVDDDRGNNNNTVPSRNTSVVSTGGKKMSHGGARNVRDMLKDPAREPLEAGDLELEITKAIDLPKSDLIGKSDPYAVVNFDGDKLKTPTAKNTQNPEWNQIFHIPIDENGPHDVRVDIFDSDKLGKDKLLGSVNIDVPDVINGNALNDEMLPLKGAKSGKVQVSANFIPKSENGSSPRRTSQGGAKEARKYLSGDDDYDDYARSPKSSISAGRDSRKQSGISDGSDLPEGMLHFNIKEARDLVKADTVGKSDPYAVLTYGDKKLKTDPVKNNQNPKWKFEGDMPVTADSPKVISLEVFDKDMIGKDKSLGKTNLDVMDIIENHPINDKWVPLEGEGIKSGQVKLSADFTPANPSDSTSGSRRASKQGDQSRRSSKQAEDARSGSRRPSGLSSPVGDAIPGPGLVHVNIKQAKDLGKGDMIGKSDPYAVLSHDGNKKKSKVERNNQNPEWNLEADFPVDRDSSKNIKVDIFDHDRLGKDKPLGSALIDITELAGGIPMNDEWIPLSGVKSGVIQVSADYIPQDQYDRAQSPRDGFGGAKNVRGKLSRSRTPEGGDSRKGSMDRRKPSGATAGSFDEIPAGNIHLNIAQAKDLAKKDIIGKSDPYAIITYGNDKVRSNSIKNNQNPQWNFEVDIPVDPNGPEKIQIDVFDEDKHGRDKPLGSTELDITDLLNNGPLQDEWIPLSNAKTGKIQVSADFSPDDESQSRKSSSVRDPERDSGKKPLQKMPSSDRFRSPDRKSSSRRQSDVDDNVLPGNLHLNIVQAKDLIKGDMVGKSDPYAVISYDNKKIKTNAVKNTQNPEWNFEVDIPINPNGPDHMKIEVFDKDKFGKDKSLGSTNIDIPSLQNSQNANDVWLPLDNVKAGQINLSADFTPGSPTGDPKSGFSSRKASKESYGGMRNVKQMFSRSTKTSLDNGSHPSRKNSSDEKLGTIKLDVLCAKDLIKGDLIGKSDPYAVIDYDGAVYKTPIRHNTQNPDFNIQCDIDIPVNPKERNIHITVYDSDKFGKDKCIGTLNLDIGKVMNLGKLNENWHPLSGVKSGEIKISADFEPDQNSINISQNYFENIRISTQYHEVSLNRIPLPTASGEVEATVQRPSGAVDKPEVDDNNNGTISVKYQPVEEGIHYLHVKFNDEQVQGSPFKFHVNSVTSGQAYAYGPGLTHGISGEPAKFDISTKGAGTGGGLSLAVEGPSKAEINCVDNKDGTVSVSYLPTAPGEYKIIAKFADQHIPGSPFTCKVTGDNKKKNQISVGSSSELPLPGDLSEADIRALKAFIQSPSGDVEQCFLKKLPKGNIGISFTPREVGDHLVSVKNNGKHISNSPFKIYVNPQEVGDASRVKVSGDGLQMGRTHIFNKFQINTKSAGYGGLSLSIEGPSKAEIECQDNEDGTLDVQYKPTEPGFYMVNIKFADSHIPGSPFHVPISGEGSEKQTENIKRMREALPVTEVGSQSRMTFKMPGINLRDLEAHVTSPSERVEKAHITELEEGLFAVNFVPRELGVHTVTVRYREIDIPGSPFQFTVGPLQDSGSHRVHAGGPGLERGMQGEPAEFNVWTREAGPGSLAISVEGPSKAQIDFKDRKDGSCYVSYTVEESGEYSVGIRFNDQHIPHSPYRVFIIPRSLHADKVRVSNFSRDKISVNTPQAILVAKNGAQGNLQCKVVSPTGREDDCYVSQVSQDEYSVRYVPRENGTHFLHAKLDGVHIPGSPFSIKVGDDRVRGDGSVRVLGNGVDRVTVGQRASFVIDTSEVGAGTLSVTVDGPSKVDMDCSELDRGYEVSYTPTISGDYLVTVKYNGMNVEGSPFKVVAVGGGASSQGTVKARRESTTMSMETIQHTTYKQETMFSESNTSRSSSRKLPIQFNSDAAECSAAGTGLQEPVLGRQNSFSVDCSKGGNNVLYVGVYGPDSPCEEVQIRHEGNRQYRVSYCLRDRGDYLIFVKWGDDHIPGSPFHVQV